jgi:hypothetical protein
MAIGTATHGVATPGKALNIAFWTLQVLAALAFLAAGLGKLLGSADMIALFNAVGIGQWFRYVTGVLEVLGAVLLIVPSKTAVGAVARLCDGRSRRRAPHRAPHRGDRTCGPLCFDRSDCVGTAFRVDASPRLVNVCT